MKEQEFTIRGMTCQHCVMAVRNELSKLPGVEIKDVRIGSARVAYDEASVTAEQLRSAVGRAGYSVV